jgi:hypothetical protein
MMDTAKRRSTRPTAPGAELGIVLVGALLLLALLAAAVGATLWLTRSELWVAGRARAFLQARYSAESGVRHALVLLSPGTDFTRLVAGAGGIADRSRPGPLPFAGGGWVAFPGPPFGYSVGVRDVGSDAPGGSTADGNELVVLDSTGSSVRGAVRSVRATIGRKVSPYAPALLVVSGGNVRIDPHGPGIEDGGIVLDARLPAGGEQAIVGATTWEAADAAFGALRGAHASLLGEGQTILVRPFDVAEFTAASGLARQGPHVLAVPSGSLESPTALAIEPGIAPALRGVGAILGIGDLEIRGEVDFRGVVVVHGALRLGASPCHITGMVWASEVVLDAACLLDYDQAAIAAADRALRLPRLPVLLALSDG